MEIIFKAADPSYVEECSAGAENLSTIVNNQGDGTTTITADPVMSFLTAGSVLEVEADQAVAENGGKSLLPTFILVSAAVAAVVIMI